MLARAVVHTRQRVPGGLHGELDCNTVTKCDTEKHTCVGCLIDTDCPQGSICVGDTCIQGCSGMQPCQPGFTCCGQLCFNLASDEQNCGMWNSACPILAHSTSLCEESSCTLGVCDAGWKDCDLNPDDGCEQNTLTDGPCVCAPGESRPVTRGRRGLRAWASVMRARARASRARRGARARGRSFPRTSSATSSTTTATARSRGSLEGAVSSGYGLVHG